MQTKGGGNSNICLFSPRNLGKWSNLTVQRWWIDGLAIWKKPSLGLDDHLTFPLLAHQRGKFPQMFDWKTLGFPTKDLKGEVGSKKKKHRTRCWSDVKWCDVFFCDTWKRSRIQNSFGEHIFWSKQNSQQAIGDPLKIAVCLSKRSR